MISVTYAGADVRHPSSFVINRPFGTGVYDLILFRTKTAIKIDGEMVTVNANTMILYDRHYRQHYHTAENYLINDYVHFNLDKETENFLLRNLIFNKPFQIEQVDAIRNLMWLIAFEYQNSYSHRESNMAQLLNVLIKKVEEETGLLQKRSNYGSYAKIISVRNKIMQNPQHDWNIKELAESCDMSESYFQIAYKKLFGTNCIADVIAARLEMAQELIRNSTMSIQEIAICCGYNSTEHFSRQFKNAHGITPLKYRNFYKNDKKRTSAGPELKAGI